MEQLAFLYSLHTLEKRVFVRPKTLELILEAKAAADEAMDQELEQFQDTGKHLLEQNAWNELMHISDRVIHRLCLSDDVSMPKYRHHENNS